MRRFWKPLGIFLLILWILPILILSIPQTGTYYQIEPGIGTPFYYEPGTVEAIKYTYIPIVNVISNSTFTALDILGCAAYIGILILSIWLIRKGRRKNATGRCSNG